MNPMERRLQKLEQGAPTGVSRPPGLAGEAIAAYVLDQITGCREAAIRSAWLDLLTHEETRILECQIRAAIAELTPVGAVQTTSRRTT